MSDDEDEEEEGRALQEREEEEEESRARVLKKTRAQLEVTAPPKEKEEKDHQPARTPRAVAVAADHLETQFQRDVDKATKRSMRDKGRVDYVFLDGG